MIYDNLFKLSGLTDTELKKKLKISKGQLKQFRESPSPNLIKLICFCQALNISHAQCSEIIQNEIRELFKK